MATGGQILRYNGGTCYAMCQDVFSWYNPSIQICWKGCDYATGRVNDPVLRKEAEDMCKRYTAEAMWTKKGELDHIEDLRIHADMFPENPRNIYRACLAGVRRQKY
ncbi:unnamed protein product (macronuclear) [Paramecium tetraurelia]|uniref:Uncharacterized protein n=2 Tax=Paramecium TaxID=5884 RepID=A0DB21_PARTE|nr:uncharacterized protein GSPATT00015132001 [Paramecium tetraurelia]CAD8160668.1 unnamed protein product [Paramecium octaurelia]CAK80238.1 unnamed protein product [Paramecium tetraurelia]|eukprot:XP_001447635.1 hypothetical protein (macronuclear) [Paramecium tetraurelia strain d4-2]